LPSMGKTQNKNGEISFLVLPMLLFSFFFAPQWVKMRQSKMSKYWVEKAKRQKAAWKKTKFPNLSSLIPCLTWITHDPATHLIPSHSLSLLPRASLHPHPVSSQPWLPLDLLGHYGSPRRRSPRLHGLTPCTACFRQS
jgi:hypothetical protein